MKIINFSIIFFVFVHQITFFEKSSSKNQTVIWSCIFCFKNYTVIPILLLQKIIDYLILYRDVCFCLEL